MEIANTASKGASVTKFSSETAIDVRVRQTDDASEIYICASPLEEADLQSQADALFSSIAATLHRHEAAILQERYFATPAAIDVLAKARKKAFAGLADGVEPTWLVVPPNQVSEVSGIQVHAVAGCGKPKVLSLDGRPCGRMVKLRGRDFIVGCNLQADSPMPRDQQAKVMIEKAERLLTQVGGTLFDVARTWMWLGDILEWYGDFNRVRNELFTARGMLKKDASGKMPASTGIGIGPAGENSCTMDFCAVLGEKPQFILSASKQDAASKYGSAFSRAAIAHTPARRTVYISGTAAIDAAGITTHIGDIEGQIQDTITNVMAVLRDAGCDKQDVVQSMVYCKTPEVEKAFRKKWGDINMPHIIMVADVCRDNLLFEIEAAAMPQ